MRQNSPKGKPVCCSTLPIELAPGAVLATDGSGGPFSSHPRKRQCACSVVAVVELDGEFVELGHVVANVVAGREQQTVPR